MTYKIEVPVPNDILSDRALSGYIDTLGKYADHISCIYLPLGHVADGIDVWGIRAPSFCYLQDGTLNREALSRWEWSLLQIHEYVDLPVKILMNNMYSRAFHDADALHLMHKKLDYYRDRFTVQSVTIADYTLVPFLQEQGLPISLSTNSHNTFSELDIAFSLYGPLAFESVVIQRDLNRNPNKLNSYLSRRHIVGRSVLMVNEGCVNACPFKSSGDMEISVSDVYTKNNVIHNAGCSMLQHKDNEWMFLTSPFLTKAMVDKYFPKIERIKLAGRDLPISKIKYQLDHWVNGTDYGLSKVLNVWPSCLEVSTSDLDVEYVKDVMTCNKECYVCGKCKTSLTRMLERRE